MYNTESTATWNCLKVFHYLFAKFLKIMLLNSTKLAGSIGKGIVKILCHYGNTNIISYHDFYHSQEMWLRSLHTLKTSSYAQRFTNLLLMVMQRKIDK